MLGDRFTIYCNLIRVIGPDDGRANKRAGYGGMLLERRITETKQCKIIRIILVAILNKTIIILYTMSFFLSYIYLTQKCAAFTVLMPSKSYLCDARQLRQKAEAVCM